MTRKILQRELLTITAYGLLAVIFTYPLILHLNTHVIGPYYGDNLEYLWRIWWVSHALFEEGTSPFYNADVYYPHDYKLAYAEITPIHTVFPAPLTQLIGDIPVYNLAILLSFVLSGWFMYLLARRWLSTIATTPAILYTGSFFCGIAFAFCAYRMVRAVGHLNLIDTHWLILAFLGLDRWIETRSWWDVLLLATGITLAALSSWYYPFMLAFVLPVYLLARISSVREIVGDRRTWFSAALVLLIVAAICYPFLVPYLEISSEGETTIPLEDASFWAASPLDYLMPNPQHPVWGKAVQFLMWPIPEVEMPLEFMVTTGWVVLFFGFWGWRSVQGHQWRAIKWIIIVAFVLSLGPYLHLGRFPLPVPLPVLALREIVPVADGIRSWGRFSIFVVMGMSVLAGAGLVILLNQVTAWRPIGLMGLLLLTFSLWTGPLELIKVEPRPVDLWLAEQPGDFAIMQYPIDTALSGASLFYTRYHQKWVVFGYGTYFTFLFKERHPDLYEFPSKAALDQLAEWDVRYILIDLEALDEEDFDMAAVDAEPCLRYVATLENQAVYELIHE